MRRSHLKLPAHEVIFDFKLMNIMHTWYYYLFTIPMILAMAAFPLIMGYLFLGWFSFLRRKRPTNPKAASNRPEHP